MFLIFQTVPETVSGETPANIGAICTTLDHSTNLGLCTLINR